MERKKNQIISDYQEKHPYIGAYMECVMRSYFYGLAGFGFSASGSYALQHFSPIRLPYSNNGRILVSCIFASAVAYKICSVKTKDCQTAWMIAEEKKSGLPLSTNIEN